MVFRRMTCTELINRRSYRPATSGEEGIVRVVMVRGVPVVVSCAANTQRGLAQCRVRVWLNGQFSPHMRRPLDAPLGCHLASADGRHARLWSREILRIFFVLFGVLPLVLAQFTFKHIRIVDGVKSMIDVDLQLRPEHPKIAASKNVSETQSRVLSKRWDDSQAYMEWQPTLNRGCTLDGMLHLDDAQAGKLLIRPRQQAHSDFLELDGAYIVQFSSASVTRSRAQALGLRSQDSPQGPEMRNRQWKRCFRSREVLP
jgi:hypothetical protein